MGKKKKLNTSQIQNSTLTEKYACKKCDELFIDDNFIACHKCDSFFHKACCGLVPSAFNAIHRSSSCFWICSLCISEPTISIDNNKENSEKKIEDILSKITLALKSITDRIADLEKRCKCDNVDEIIKTVTKECITNSNTKDEQSTSYKSDIVECQRGINENEQYSRRNSVRIFGLNERNDESNRECIDEVIRFFRRMGLGVKLEDIDTLHRVGMRRGDRPRPVIVKFVRRLVKDHVMKNTFKLKGSGMSIHEDLTKINYNLLKSAQVHNNVEDVWSTNGKVVALLSNGCIKKLDPLTDLETQLEPIGDMQVDRSFWDSPAASSPPSYSTFKPHHRRGKSPRTPEQDQFYQKSTRNYAEAVESTRRRVPVRPAPDNSSNGNTSRRAYSTSPKPGCSSWNENYFESSQRKKNNILYN